MLSYFFHLIDHSSGLWLSSMKLLCYIRCLPYLLAGTYVAGAESNHTSAKRVSLGENHSSGSSQGPVDCGHLLCTYNEDHPNGSLFHLCTS